MHQLPEGVTQGERLKGKFRRFLLHVNGFVKSVGHCFLFHNKNSIGQVVLSGLLFRKATAFAFAFFSPSTNIWSFANDGSTTVAESHFTLELCNARFLSACTCSDCCSEGGENEFQHKLIKSD